MSEAGFGKSVKVGKTVTLAVVEDGVNPDFFFCFSSDLLYPGTFYLVFKIFIFIFFLFVTRELKV